MKHTKGPWEITKTCEVIDGFDFEGVKKINGWGYHLYKNETDIEAEANARLIAAAPEMLEALIELVAEFEEKNRELADKENYSYYPESGGIVFARIIIAKAEGR